jgi:hypothetical protein
MFVNILIKFYATMIKDNKNSMNCKLSESGFTGLED